MFTQQLNAELDQMEREYAETSRLGRLTRRLPAAKTQRQPLIARWWIPYVCAAGVLAVWTPDQFKVRALYWMDQRHDNVKLAVHKWYWYYTMPADRYAILMEQLEANVPKSERVKSTDCPL